MEKKLKKLFDFQRFEQNKALEKLIPETENRYAAELSDDDLALVSAAGEPQNIDSMIRRCQNILKQMDLTVDDAQVKMLIGRGGTYLQQWALSKTGGNPKAYTLPRFD